VPAAVPDGQQEEEPEDPLSFWANAKDDGTKIKEKNKINITFFMFFVDDYYFLL
jgi:hypothetical protein